jgi:hypothetical protein
MKFIIIIILQFYAAQPVYDCGVNAFESEPRDRSNAKALHVQWFNEQVIFLKLAIEVADCTMVTKFFNT